MLDSLIFISLSSSCPKYCICLIWHLKYLGRNWQPLNHIPLKWHSSFIYLKYWSLYKDGFILPINFRYSHPVVLIDQIIRYKLRLTQHLVREYHVLITVILLHVPANPLGHHQLVTQNVKRIMFLGRGLPFTVLISNGRPHLVFSPFSKCSWYTQSLQH